MIEFNTILGIETATDASTLALYHQGKWYVRSNLTPKMHSELMLPMLQSLLQEASIEMTDIRAIGVGVGPGSFTGVRLAVGLAQAFGFGLDIPIWPVSTLAALSFSALAHITDPSTYLLPVWDARMQAVYWGIYKLDEQLGVRAIVPDCLTAPERVCLPDCLNHPILAIGSGVGAYYSSIASKFHSQHWQHVPQVYPSAQAVVSLTRKMIQSGIEPVSPHLLTPHYIRNDVAQVAKSKVVPAHPHKFETA